MAEKAFDSCVDFWRFKKLLKFLEFAKGNGTSLITLLIPQKDQISRVTRMLGEELGTASSIKSKLNRQSVESAITSILQKLKLYKCVPKNGLVIFSGTVITKEGKNKKHILDFEPTKPMSDKLYLCDNKFYIEPLKSMLREEESYGFIIIDGQGTLFANVSGNARTILQKFSAGLPKKHARGGSSAARFGRERLLKRQAYIKKVAETAKDCFINAELKANVSGIIVAGSAELKTDLIKYDLLDNRIKEKIIEVVDIEYGDVIGLNRAIDLAAEKIGNLHFVKEKAIIRNFFDCIQRDNGKYCYGCEDTMEALKKGAVETLICWEDLEVMYFKLKNSREEIFTTHYLSPREAQNLNIFKDSNTGFRLELVEQELLVEYLIEKYSKFGTDMKIITNGTQEGKQFIAGFGGIGGILRYKMSFSNSINEENEEDFNLDEYDL
ncbi:unnamed protein product [Dimorphilus gyrociliatus]|uniref:Eukaryotic peptide chain release factor subunit 1 n=1 Tax=Dimorphilus gyrociliatus TaxID=2664684 RepID=A0A7I8VA04_9ANNE|nr:unnamed protein product [Dimorphilus gyrociliatus]